MGQSVDLDYAVVLCRVQFRFRGANFNWLQNLRRNFPELVLVNSEELISNPVGVYSKPALLALAKRLLANVFQHRSGEDRIALPWQKVMRQPYPSARWGGSRELELETLARSMFLAACSVANDPAFATAGIPLREFYLQWLLGLARDGRFLPLKGRHDQAIVEAALICMSLEEGRFLEAARPKEREEILGWLAAYSDAPVMRNR